MKITPHIWPSVKGFSLLAITHPLFAARLFWHRLTFRHLGWSPFSDPHGFRIDSQNTLLSYWTIMVAGDGFIGDWMRPFRKEDGPLIIDIGANAGLFMHRCWMANTSARFIALEPQPEMANRLRETYPLHPVIEAAASDTTGTITLYREKSGDGGAMIDPSLDPDDVGSKSDAITVRMDTLDNMLAGDDRPVFLVKIDVEGHEPAVLRGATETLKRARFVLAEAWTERHRQRLADLLGIEWECTRAGVMDCLFTRKDAS